MGSASKLWEKAEQNAGAAAKDLSLDGDLGSALDNLDAMIKQYLALENKMFRVAKRMFVGAKKVRRIADGNSATIRAAAASKSGQEKAVLTILLASVDKAVDEIQDSSIGELSFRMKREIAMSKRITRAVK